MSDWVVLPKQVAISRGMTYYYSLLPCKNGHVSKRHISGSKCSCCNRHDSANKIKDLNDQEKEKLKTLKKAYYEKNKEKINKKNAVYTAKRRATNPMYKLKHRLESRVREGLIGLKTSKSKRTQEMLGCSLKEFAEHIEKQFYGSMSWENMGEWHIDHIIPCSTAKTEQELMLLFNYTNLRPLMAKDNLVKSDRIQFLL